MIYAQAKIFHQGVVFPTELVNHQVFSHEPSCVSLCCPVLRVIFHECLAEQVETEGLAQMALRMNFTVVGLPNLIIRHA